MAVSGMTSRRPNGFGCAGSENSKESPAAVGAARLIRCRGERTLDEPTLRFVRAHGVPLSRQSRSPDSAPRPGQRKLAENAPRGRISPLRTYIRKRQRRARIDSRLADDTSWLDVAAPCL